MIDKVVFENDRFLIATVINNGQPVTGIWDKLTDKVFIDIDEYSKSNGFENLQSLVENTTFLDRLIEMRNEKGYFPLDDTNKVLEL